MLRNSRGNDSLFIARSMVFGGDLVQILPIARRKTDGHADVVSACLQRFVIWPQMPLMWFEDNMRLQSGRWRLNLPTGW